MMPIPDFLSQLKLDLGKFWYNKSLFYSISNLVLIQKDEK